MSGYRIGGGVGDILQPPSDESWNVGMASTDANAGEGHGEDEDLADPTWAAADGAVSLHGALATGTSEYASEDKEADDAEQEPLERMAP